MELGGTLMQCRTLLSLIKVCGYVLAGLCRRYPYAVQSIARYMGMY